MTLDLIRTLILLAGLALHGQPDDWDVAVQAAMVLTPEGPALELLWDPVAIYIQEPPGGACGVSYGQFVLVHPQPERLGCSRTLEHELGHVWQWRGWGLLPLYSEPSESWRQVPPAPRVMRHSLLRISFPLR